MFFFIDFFLFLGNLENCTYELFFHDKDFLLGLVNRKKSLNIDNVDHFYIRNFPL